MKKVDYIIVGCGLAGVAFCEQLIAANKSFLVFDNKSQQSSVVAGGLYNPVVLKRFTSVWKSKEQLEIALAMYKKIEGKLQIKIDYKIPVYRRFTSLEEQNNWFTASDNPLLAEHLSAHLIKNTNPFINADFGFGEVLNTGRIDTNTLITSYKENLIKNKQLIEEAFNYEELQLSESIVSYKDIKAKHIVFAEGFGLKQNPLFNYLPINESKGELLTIHAPDLKIDYVLKSSVFVLPLSNDLYHIGATYNWTDKTNNITKEGREELLNKLETFLNCDFKVIEQVAGIRPTVKDRRPLVGKHPKQNNVYVLNGLGTRGVMIGPYVAKQLFNYIENNIELDTEININRFSS
ncbi:NAD(P)/FAD-dependent oxidoreductase [Xanthomarina spongicola]|uniref:Glycine/D-amino acid oxidase-like deaminating enzyme n=1 Tax=Xanthomarina spongicola TaxID=570520 RepID=A0A316DTG3_9FLAO|nr:FAD-binding oxidoreductase [Xanthomarina spongicola]PWK21086.1 glycine/D-amino acid oxidase-like deaminating enzyme [Xanthomarina spongicola]